MSEKIIVQNAQRLFDWDIPLEENDYAEGLFGELASNVDELIDLMFETDDFFQEEGNSVRSGPDGDCCIGLYSVDAVKWAANSILSAKKLRSELESKLGSIAASIFYENLKASLYFHVENETVSIISTFKSWPDPPEKKNISVKILLNQLNPQTGFEFLAGQVLYNGQDLNISGLKHTTLETLHKNLGRVVSRETLLNEATKAIHYISELNRLFEAEKIPFHIYTITGHGYKLDEIERS